MKRGTAYGIHVWGNVSHTSICIEGIGGRMQYRDDFLPNLQAKVVACHTHKERYCDLVGVWPAFVEAFDFGPSIDVNPESILCHRCRPHGEMIESRVELNGAGQERRRHAFRPHLHKMHSLI